MIVKLDTFKNTGFDKQTSRLKWILWILTSAIVFRTSFIPFMGFKIFILRMFGAEIGCGLVIKTSVNIKFPWKLSLGDYVWLGEGVWVDNLDRVTIGNNVCVSQGALLLTGNHDYKLVSFDYRNAPIVLEDGVWIGANSTVCPGVVCKTHSVLSVGSVATNKLEPYRIYQGNPAVFVRERKFI